MLGDPADQGQCVERSRQDEFLPLGEAEPDLDGDFREAVEAGCE
jgi:hypothetical protein